MDSRETSIAKRLQLAEELANLVEALRDPETGEGMVEELEDKGEVRLFAVLGKSKTVVVIKTWSKEELAQLKSDAEALWPEFLDAEQDTDET